ncbi:PPIC-type PPIASE domain-containing protein [Flaviramulus basaltis]|uniref:peptidylprolyl isomerase n=1 Tax=Flaviramulus basaltis TaxID=369401 RepID=A0A1K2IHC9_9FLAO|nr:peptidylprolyl isomerase [Flaviramulus basaltis]SFZ91833.1 PPIC-type PPIASE domain-containing protein [Flaviramulus basaltis]
MQKQLLFLIFISITSFLNAQTSTEKELAIIETPEQIKTYLDSKKSKKNKLVTFNEEKHKTKLAKALFKLHVGGTETSENEFEKTFYKVVNKTTKTYYRVAYIYLDGSKYDKANIKATRDEIISKCKKGIAFDFLAKQYSMDGSANKGGDLGWFTKGEMHPEFESKVLNNNYGLNDVFTIDIPSKNWYYVVLKTHEPKEISEIEVLKIVENRN